MMGYKKVDLPQVERAVRSLLEALGEDVNRPGLQETPRRVAKYWAELLEGEDYTNAEIAQMFSKDFQVGYDSIVIKEIRNVYSNCEHHTVLFHGTVYVAYIPEFWNNENERDGYRVLGLSKLPRIVDMCARRLQLQEKLNADVAECVSLATGSTRVYVRSVMDHGCVSARGIRSEGFTDVTYISPALRQDPDARREIEGKVQELHLSSVR
jgi:GTP cyclohydrolase I